MCLKFVRFLKEIEIKRRKSNIFWKKMSDFPRGRDIMGGKKVFANRRQGGIRI